MSLAPPVTIALLTAPGVPGTLLDEVPVASAFAGIIAAFHSLSRVALPAIRRKSHWLIRLNSRKACVWLLAVKDFFAAPPPHSTWLSSAFAAGASAGGAKVATVAEAQPLALPLASKWRTNTFRSVAAATPSRVNTLPFTVPRSVAASPAVVSGSASRTSVKE